MARKNSNQIKSLAITFVLAVFVIVAGIVSNQFPDQVNNYIEQNLNIPTENTITVQSVSTTVVSSDSKLQIYYFDVGQADSSLIIANDKTMLIDCGNNEDGPLLVNYIQALGIQKIDYLIGTHPHEDHIGGMDDIINNLDIGTIYMPDVTTNTNTFESVLEAISNKALTISTCNIGDTFVLGDGIATIMSVSNEDESDLNLNSIVIRFVFGNQSFLFMGDAEEKNEAEITWPATDVIKIGHHGSDTSTSEKFINAVKPKVAIISVGKDNTYNHPSSDVISRLQKLGTTIYRTDESGTILLTSNGTNYEIQTVPTNLDGNT